MPVGHAFGLIHADVATVVQSSLGTIHRMPVS